MIHLTEQQLESLVARTERAKAPNARAAAELVLRLLHWTNANSDGWAYWAPPRKAAQRLLRELEEWDRAWFNGQDIDILETDLARARAIVKRFLFRQEADGRLSAAAVDEIVTGEAPNVTIVATFNVKPSDVITLTDTLTLKLGGTVDRVVR